MATENDHIALANRNQDALDFVLQHPDRFAEWIATITFYKAVQVVEAVFSHYPFKHCSDHRDRLARLKVGDFKPIFKHYRVLWQASTIARYLHDNASSKSYSCFTDWMKAEKVERKLVLDRLRPIEQFAVSKLSEPAKAALKRIPS